ncbi:MAG: RDD family protein [Mycobacteriales bacterium]
MTRAAGQGAPRDSEPGSVAPAGPRLGAFVVDIVLSALVAGIFTAPELPRNRSLLVFAVLYFGFTVLVQQTPGMRLLKLRVVRVDRPAPIGLWRSLARTLGVILLVPALLRDETGRALHDRLTQTAVVRA